MSAVIFWFAAVSIVYAYLGFPIVVALVGLLRNKVVCRKPFEPRISVVIAAYNEEKNIDCKLENTLALEYPRELLDIVVASDGSTDATETIVQKYEAEGVRLLCLPRQGKIAALDKAVAGSHGEIIVFTDATTMLDAGALRVLMQNFSDKTVGGVSGNQRHNQNGDRDLSNKGEILYWRYDKWLKELESRTGSIVSANGAFYAIRRELYESPASKMVTDDFFISTGVVAQGYRLVYEAEAIAVDPPAERAGMEFTRKVRIVNSGLLGVYIRRALLNPFRYGIYSLILFSHKVLRRFVPFLMILLFFSSVALSNKGVIYESAAFIQGLFYVLALLGYFLRESKLGKWKIFYVPFFYCLANAAAFIAILKLARGERVRLWEPAR